MGDTDMTKEQFNQIMQRFQQIDTRVANMDTRVANMERHMVTKSDVHGAVFQGLAFAAAAVVGTVVVLNALGAFT